MPWTASRLAALAWVAGEIDTFGYLRLGHVFISHMTGNTAVLSIALAQRDVTDALHRGILIPLFFLGGLCGALLVDSADEPRQVSRALVVEALLLASFAALEWFGAGHFDRSPGGRVFMLLLLSGSMGLQNAALTRRASRDIHTTHITGPLTEFAVELAHLTVRRRRHEFDPARAQRLAARLIGFSSGALCGAALFTLAPTAAPVAAVGVLLVLVTLTSSRPAAAS